MKDIPINLYVDPTWRRNLPHIALLYPFWGNCLDKVRVPYQRTLFERHHFDTTKYSITEKAYAADMILMPYSHTHVRNYASDLLELCHREARRQGKLLLIDGVGDREHPVSLTDTVVLRGGGYRFSRAANEIIIPLYADDLLEMYRDGQLQIHNKGEKPIVGFSGWASLTPAQEIRARIKELPTRLKSIFQSRYGACKKGVFFRREAISALRHSSAVTANFLIRKSYSGHREDSVGDQVQLRKEFVENLLGSDLCLDVRGDANASIRLFEILSLGRIPIIIDTERNLPFSDRVDYSSFALIVDFRDLRNLPARIAEFYTNLSPGRFIEMQKNARAAYLAYFRVDALTGPLMEALAQFIEQQRRTK